MSLTKTDRTVLEKTTAQYTATLKDEAGVVIPSADLTTLTLTLYDEATGAIINSRDNQNVLNATGVSIDASGLLTWTMDPDDNAIVDTSLAPGRTELHVARFDFTWSGGGKTGRRLILVEVRQLDKVV